MKYLFALTLALFPGTSHAAALYMPANPSLLYQLFMFMSFVGVFLILKLLIGFGYDALRKIDGTFTIALLLTPILFSVAWFMGLPTSQPLWVLLLVITGAAILEMFLVWFFQKDEMKLIEAGLFVIPTNLILFFASYALTNAFVNEYTANYSFHIVMAFVIYLVCKLLLSFIWVLFAKVQKRVILILAVAMVLTIPLIWIAMEQNYQVGYLGMLLGYATVFESMASYFFTRNPDDRKKAVMGSVLVNIITSIAIISLFLGEFSTTAL